MKKNIYVRGNGARVLKRRFQAFDKIFILGLLALIIGLHLSMQAQIKSVIKNTGDLRSEKKLLSEELNRLLSDYEKTFSYSELKDFARIRLNMVEAGNRVKSFTVFDRSGSFAEPSDQVMPELFETNVNLALLKRNVAVSEN